MNSARVDWFCYSERPDRHKQILGNGINVPSFGWNTHQIRQQPAEPELMNQRNRVFGWVKPPERYPGLQPCFPDAYLSIKPLYDPYPYLHFENTPIVKSIAGGLLSHRVPGPGAPEAITGGGGAGHWEGGLPQPPRADEHREVDEQHSRRIDITDVIDEIARAFDIDVSDLDDRLKSLPPGWKVSCQADVPRKLRRCKKRKAADSTLASRQVRSLSGRLGSEKTGVGAQLLPDYPKGRKPCGMESKRYLYPFNNSSPVEPDNALRTFQKNTPSPLKEGCKSSLPNGNANYLSLYEINEIESLPCELKAGLISLLQHSRPRELGFIGINWDTYNVSGLLKAQCNLNVSESGAEYFVYSQGATFSQLNF